MLLTVVLILFAIVALAALEITLFRRLAEREDRRRSDKQAFGRGRGWTEGSVSDAWTPALPASFTLAPRRPRRLKRAARTREPGCPYPDLHDACDQAGSRRARSRHRRWMG